VLIERVDDGKRFPRCPDCGVVLYQESMDLTNSQKKLQAIYDACDHVMVSGVRGVGVVCKKCGFGYHKRFIPVARLMRCPRCAALYHVEEEWESGNSVKG